MFAPQGYAIFEYQWETIFFLADQFAPIGGETRDLRYLSMRRNVDLRRSLVNEFVANCPSLSIVSPRGDILRISHSIVYDTVELQLVPTYLGPLFLCEETWTIRAKRYRARRLAAQRLVDSDFVDAEWLSTDGKERVMFACAHEQVCSALEAFEGWALTFAEHDAWVRPRDFPSLQLLEVAIGDSARIDDIAQEIIREFDSGVAVTKEYVRRRWFANEKRETFLNVWKIVTSQRPMLSRPGPRRSAGTLPQPVRKYIEPKCSS